jgi:hypothetical protein
MTTKHRHDNPILVTGAAIRSAQDWPVRFVEHALLTSASSANG